MRQPNLPPQIIPCVVLLLLLQLLLLSVPTQFVNANDEGETAAAKTAEEAALVKDEKLNAKASESSTVLKEELEGGGGSPDASGTKESSSSSQTSYSSHSSTGGDGAEGSESADAQERSALKISKSSMSSQSSSSASGGATGSGGASSGGVSAGGKKKTVKKTIVIEESSDEGEEAAKQAAKKKQQEEDEAKQKAAGGGEGGGAAAAAKIDMCEPRKEVLTLPPECFPQQIEVKPAPPPSKVHEQYSGQSMAEMLNFLTTSNGRIQLKNGAAYADLVTACADYLPLDACHTLKPMCAVSDTARAIRFLRERSDYILYMSSDLQKHIDYVKSTVPAHNPEYSLMLQQNLDNIKNLLPSVTKTAPLIRLILDEDSEEELERIVNAHLRFKQECEQYKKQCAEGASKRGLYVADLYGIVDVPTKECQQYNDMCCCNGYKFHHYYQSLVREEQHRECREARAMRRATRRLVESVCASSCGSCPTRYRVAEYAQDLVRAFDCDRNKSRKADVLAVVNVVHQEKLPLLPSTQVVHVAALGSPAAAAGYNIVHQQVHSSANSLVDDNDDHGNNNAVDMAMLDVLMGAATGAAGPKQHDKKEIHLHQLLQQQQQNQYHQQRQQTQQLASAFASASAASAAASALNLRQLQLLQEKPQLQAAVDEDDDADENSHQQRQQHQFSIGIGGNGAVGDVVGISNGGGIVKGRNKKKRGQQQGSALLQDGGEDGGGGMNKYDPTEWSEFPELLEGRNKKNGRGGRNNGQQQQQGSALLQEGGGDGIGEWDPTRDALPDEWGVDRRRR